MTNLQSKLYSAFDSDPTPIVQFLQWLAASYGVPDRPQFLDVGCGPGRLLQPCARLGWQVVGLEPDPDFYAQAQATAGQTRTIGVVPGGFNDITYREAFDLIVGVNSSFSHVLTGTARADAFRRMFRALTPHGIIFLDVGNFLWILKHYREPTEQRRVVQGQEIRLRRQHEIDVHDATFTTLEEYTMVDAKHEEVKVTKRHVYAMTSFPELAYLLRETGFVDLRTYNSYAARQNERLTGPRMMLSAQRPA